jgi:hypothetical protein
LKEGEMEKLYQDSETGCCPRFDPNPWDEKEVSFKDRLFLKDRVMPLFHIPLNFGQVMKRDMEKIQKAGALAPKPLMLSDSSSLWGTDVYIAVDKEVPGAKMERISGIFLTKVFEGEYKNMGKWTKEMKGFVEAKGKSMKRIYFFYTTCPACAKYYGKNYTVILAKV